MGSSSAAIVAGVQLARALTVGGTDLLDDAGALRVAAGIEGHPDNVAPCLLGGFTIAWTEASGARAVRLGIAAGVRPTVFIPAERGLTATARAALPSERAARGRRVQRGAGGPAGARADRRSGAAASRRPRTGCTRATGPRACPDGVAGRGVALARGGGRGQRGGPDRAGADRTCGFSPRNRMAGRR